MRMDSDNVRNDKNSEVFYCKIQSVFCRNKGRDEIRKDVRITLEIATGVSSVGEKILKLKLTDDNDPFFYYALRLNEEDFRSLKSQQGLLVDFHNFPSQLCILLQQCTGGKENEKFVLILDDEGIDPTVKIFQIVEKNDFKHLCHLMLLMGNGSDDEIKLYMCNQIQNLKEKKLRLEKTLSQFESSLMHIQSDLKQKCIELEDMRRKWTEEKNELQMDHLNTLQEERERFTHEQRQLQRDHQRQQQELERRHAEVISNLESQIAELKTMNQTNFDKLCQANSKNKELKDELVKRQQDITLLQNELVAARKQSAELDKDYHEKEIKSSQLQIQNSMLKEELREKVELLSKSQEQVSHLSNKKREMEHKLDEREESLKHKSSAMETLSRDLIKANEILARMQKQLAEANSKLKLRTKISNEQEKVIERKEGELIELRNEIKKLEEQCKMYEGSEKELRESLTLTTQKLEEKEKTVQNNNNVITWLNKKLNELQQKKTPQPPAQYITSTPIDTRGWIRTPPEIRNQQSIPVQRLMIDSRGQHTTMQFQHDKNDKLRPTIVTQGLCSKPTSSGTSGDSKPRTAPTVTNIEIKTLNDNLAVKNPDPKNPILKNQIKPPLPRPFVPPASAYFTRPSKS